MLNTSPLDHEALKTCEGVKKRWTFGPLAKDFGSALANQIVSLAVIFQIIVCVNDLHNSPGSKEKKRLACSIVPFVQNNNYMRCYLLARTILLLWTTGHNFFKPHNIHYHSHNFTLIWLHVFECRVSLDSNLLFCKLHFIFVFALKVGIPWSYGKSWLLPSGNLEYSMQAVYMA